MKTISINIPTSLAELKHMIKEHKSKRMRHNIQVLKDFAREIYREVESNYWNDDISITMIDRVFDYTSQNSFINKKYNEAKSKLK